MKTKFFSASGIFVVSSVIVNAANYGFNLLLGRWLGAAAYSDAVFYTTLALSFSFVALMFQMTATRYIAVFDDDVKQDAVRHYLQRLALIWGISLGFLLSISAWQCQKTFQLQAFFPIICIGLSLPFYFVMSVGRGILQGKLQFLPLAVTYQMELWAKVLGTLLLLFLGFQAASVAFATALSFVAALFVLKNIKYSSIKSESINEKEIFSFFLSVGFYELSQILINNSDVLLAKSYLSPTIAGQYAALAMIGRIVFFSSFPIVMVVIPMLINKIKNNEPYQKFFYGSIIACLSVICVIVLGCYLFSGIIISLLFGDAFLSVSPYLWQYALATGLFTLCNIFIYFHLSLNQKKIVWLPIVAGLLQIALTFLQHTDIQCFINAQIGAMSILFLSVLGFHIKDKALKR
jgi:O-antigen/teichoic acid export membrane protein